MVDIAQPRLLCVRVSPLPRRTMASALFMTASQSEGLECAISCKLLQPGESRLRSIFADMKCERLVVGLRRRVVPS
jgi:hypothetical protein